jgi:dTDP-4-amino-4,6-dideoxygalactose transaminase
VTHAPEPERQPVYLSPPDVSSVERELLLEAFDSNWIAPLGPQVDAFEREMASFLGVSGAVAMSSGTAALHLALLLLDVGPSDEVVVPTLTFVATASAVLYTGARPVFIDSEAESWNLDPALLDEELRVRADRGHLPAAVIGVDLFGQCANWEPILASCEHYGVPVIEDAAEALGATYRHQAAGSLGAIGVFSFNGNKMVTTSGGGMLVSPLDELTERARYLATQACDPAPHYQHSEVGYNYRLSNLLAAVGRGQLRRLPQMVRRRRAIKARYRRELADLPGIAFMPDAPFGEPTNWLTVMTVDEREFGATPENIRQRLAQQSIEARPAWKPLHLQPVFDGAPIRGGRMAETIFRTGLCLPSGSALSESDQARVIDVVGDACWQSAE